MFTQHPSAVSISRTGVLALFVLLPVLFLPFAWATIAQIKMLLVAACVLIAVGAWLFTQWRGRKIAVPASVVLPVALVLPIAYALSGFLVGGSASFVGSGVELDTVTAMVLWVAALFVAAVSLTPGRVVVRAYRFVLVAALAVAVFHTLGIIAGSTSFGLFVGPAASIVGSWHDLAIFLGLGVLLSASLLGSTFNTGRWRWLAYVVLGVSMLLLILVNARDVWIALAAIACAGIGYLWFMERQSTQGSSSESLNTAAAPQVATQSQPAATSQSQNRRMPMKVLAGIAGVAVVFAVFGSTIVGYMPNRLQIGQAEVRPSWKGTGEVLRAIYHGEGVVFGSGPSTFGRAWTLYKPSGVNETAFWDTEFSQGVGFIPTAFATTGVVGGIAWLLFIAAFLFTGVRTLLNRVGDPHWRMPIFAIFSGVAFLWTMLFVYPPGGTLVALAFLMMGLFVAAARASGTLGTWQYEFSGSRFDMLAVAGLVGVLLVVFAATAGVTRALTADMLVNRGISTYNATQDIDAAARNIDWALTVRSDNDRALRALVELNMIRFSQLAADQATAESEEARAALQASLEKAIESGLSAVSADSGNYQNWLTLAAAYENLAGASVQGAYENALQAYERARTANPTSPLPLLALARLSLVQKDTAAAREHLTGALSLKNNFAPAWYLLSQIDASENQIASSTIAAQNAAVSAPQEPAVWLQLGTLYYAQEQYEQAVAALQNAVTLNANYANALYVLGFAHYRSGNIEAALGAFERVAVLNPDNKDLATIVSSLRESGRLPESGEEE